MFEIKDVDFHSDYYGMESYLNNWPMLYILENGKKAYIGQTTNIVKRMAQHKQNELKQGFQRAHFIYSDKFNQSSTFDYESRLISLMAADNKFVLTNLNVGLTGIDYYDKSFYDKEFIQLWEKLQQKNLAVHAIEELQQSDLFKYSPYKELSADQRKLVQEITENLKRDLNRCIVVNGMPGSGKTILAIYLFKLLRESQQFNKLKIALVVSPTSLRDTLKRVFKSINNLSNKDVIGPNEVADQKYDILLVDEAHRLKKRMNLSDYKSYDQTCEKLGVSKESNQLDWIITQSKCAILFYDHDQLIFPQGLKIDTLLVQNYMSKKTISFHYLLSQMRCKCGSKYLEDMRLLLDCKLNHKVFDTGYELVLVKSFDEFEKLYRHKESNFELTRMVAGYAWPWKSKKDKTLYDICIENHKLKWNSTLKNWVYSKNAPDEVGCIHSIQGYDLNYAFVILGPDIRYDSDTKKIVIDENQYYDRYGKIGTDRSELEAYIKNIYYVLLSRGVRGTYIYVYDDNLRDHLAKYINVLI